MNTEQLRSAEKIAHRFDVSTVHVGWHNAINGLVFSGLVSAWVGVVVASMWLPPLLYVLLAGPALGWLIFAWFAAVVHEASHEMLWLRRTNTGHVRAHPWNDRLARWGCAAFGVSYDGEWKRGHLLHHNHPLEPRDPQNCRVPIGRELFWLLAKLLLVPGYAILVTARTRSTAGPFSCSHRIAGIDTCLTGQEFAIHAAFWLLHALGYLMLTQSWIPGLAVVAATQVASAANVIKVALEHGGLEHKTDRRLRSRTSSIPMRWLFMPFNVSMHFEHHLNMRVPWYRLGKLHRNLRAI